MNFYCIFGSLVKLGYLLLPQYIPTWVSPVNLEKKLTLLYLEHIKLKSYILQGTLPLVLPSWLVGLDAWQAEVLGSVIYFLVFYHTLYYAEQAKVFRMLCLVLLSLVQYLYKLLVLEWFFKCSQRNIYNVNYKQYMVILGKFWLLWFEMWSKHLRFII